MDLLSFLYSGLTISLVIVFGYLSIVLLTVLLPKLIHPSYGRLQSLRLMAIKMFFLNANQLPKLSRKLAVLMFCFNCFFFFNNNLLSSAVQTDATLLKTDEILLSEADLLNSKKTILTRSSDHHRMRSSPASSLFGRLSKKKHLILESEKNVGSLDRIFRQGLTSFYYLAESMTLLGALSVLAPFANTDGLVTFTRPHKYREWLSVFSLRRSLNPQRKRFIHRRYLIPELYFS